MDTSGRRRLLLVCSWIIDPSDVYPTYVPRSEEDSDSAIAYFVVISVVRFVFVTIPILMFVTLV